MKDLNNLPTKHKEFDAMKKALSDKQKKKSKVFKSDEQIYV